MKKQNFKFKVFLRIGTFLMILMMIYMAFLSSVSSAPSDLDLVEQYSPILYYESDETCYPVDISYHIDNSYLYLFTVDEIILVDDSPTSEELAFYSELGGDNSQYGFLDNKIGTIDDDKIINDYQSKMNTLGFTIYSRVYTSGSTTVIQYWFFYAFNKGELNQHEGDWEMVQVILSDGDPTNAMYSQHHSGQSATWNQVERDGDHIKVYVARGSHANYLRPYSGKVGVASDIVGANGKVLRQSDYSIELLEDQKWLDYEGKWGEFQSIEDILRGRVGPEGPKYRENENMWNNPISWGNGLMKSNDNLFLLEWFVYNFVTIFLLITALTIGIIAFKIYRRYKKFGLGPRIISILYIDGLNLSSIGNILCIIGLIVAIVSLFNPWYAVSVGINVEGFETSGMVDMISIDGIEGIRINLLDTQGPQQLGTLDIPFSLFIAVSLVFLIIATIGISSSKKLGKKYIWRGVKLTIPIIIILIAVMSLGMLPLSTGIGSADNIITETLGTISSSPFSGNQAISVSEQGVSGQINLQWGLRLGGQLLLYSGIIMLIAGILEFIQDKSFFITKKVEKSIKEKNRKLFRRKKENDTKIENNNDNFDVEKK